MIKYGDRVKDKLNLLVETLIDTIPRKLKAYSIFEESFTKLKNELARRTIVRIGRIKYFLANYEDIFIISFD